MNHYSNPCCERSQFINLSKMEIVPVIVQENCFIDFKEPTLWYSVASIVFCPLFWNMMIRWEDRTRKMSFLFGDSHRACVTLAFIVLLLVLYRDVTFIEAMKHQSRWSALQNNTALWSAYIMLLYGTLLILYSFWALGFIGTFFGDYFTFTLPKRVTGFPFNLFNHPMYIGDTLNFTAIALIKCSQAGLFLCLVLTLSFIIASKFYEGPYTKDVYERVEMARKKKKS